MHNMWENIKISDYIIYRMGLGSYDYIIYQILRSSNDVMLIFFPFTYHSTWRLFLFQLYDFFVFQETNEKKFFLN